MMAGMYLNTGRQDEQVPTCRMDGGGAVDGLTARPRQLGRSRRCRRSQPAPRSQRGIRGQPTRARPRRDFTGASAGGAAPCSRMALSWRPSRLQTKTRKANGVRLRGLTHHMLLPYHGASVVTGRRALNYYRAMDGSGRRRAIAGRRSFTPPSGNGSTVKLRTEPRQRP